MARITRRKQEAPKRMKYGENGTKLEPLTAPPSDDTQNQDDEAQTDEDDESENESAPNSPDVCDGADQELDPAAASLSMPVRTPLEPSIEPTPSIGDNENESKWTNAPTNGVTKMETEQIMDLSSKRHRSVSDDEPEVKIPRLERESHPKTDESLPLDLSQKSSRFNSEPAIKRPTTPPASVSVPQPISPSLASLQKKFGGGHVGSKTPVEVAHGTTPPVTSHSRLWYSNVYRQSIPAYSMYAPKLPYYPLADVPLHATYPTLAAAAAGLIPDLPSSSSLGNIKPPKPTTNHHSVTMTTKSQQPSITQSTKHTKTLLLPKTHHPTTTPPGVGAQVSPMTSPRAPPITAFDLKDCKSNCIDFKCDCGKTYSTLYELSVHMQDTGHMPRNTKAGPSGDYPKLVRGQDMWLNNGLEQTKQILRCMHCGESFKTLPELTVHMMKTQHYADIFSSAHRKMHKCTTFFEKENDTKSVFKCRVCETEYDSLDSLANHMVESRHHKRNNSKVSDDPVKVRQSLLASMTGEDCDSDDTPPLLSPDTRSDDQCIKPMDFKTTPHHDHAKPRDTTCAGDVIIKPDVIKTEHYAGGDVILPPSVHAQNGDVNHNTDKDSNSSVTSPVTSSEEVKVKLTNGRDTPVSENEDDEENHNIKCENCFVRIKTDLFVEHVRHCISRDRKMTSSDKAVTSVSTSSSSSSQDKIPVPRQKEGSALKAMEQFIENFNERKPTKSQAPMSSLLYDYVGTLGQKSGSDQARLSMDKARSYYDRPEQSALHSLYRFTSYGPQRMTSLESSGGVTVTPSPLPSPKQPSPRHSPPNDVIRQNDIAEALRKEEERTSVSPRTDDVRVRNSPSSVPSPSRLRDRDSNSSPGDCGYHSNDVESASDDVKKSTSPINSVLQQNGRISPGNASQKSSDSDHPPNGKKASALESLKGLVDKRLDRSEHPLNSLQKLINQTDGNHASSVNSLQSRLINVTSSPYWFSFSHLTRGWQGARRSESPKSDENQSVVDSDGVEVKVSDLKCDLCGKLFSSRGGCRYHRSRCSQAPNPPPPVTKGAHNKEAQIVQTPYTYMPLEHTNKFSKYYEMARELANKSS